MADFFFYVRCYSCSLHSAQSLLCVCTEAAIVGNFSSLKFLKRLNYDVSYIELKL